MSRCEKLGSGKRSEQISIEEKYQINTVREGSISSSVQGSSKAIVPKREGDSRLASEGWPRGRKRSSAADDDDDNSGVSVNTDAERVHTIILCDIYT